MALAPETPAELPELELPELELAEPPPARVSLPPIAGEPRPVRQLQTASHHLPANHRRNSGCPKYLRWSNLNRNRDQSQRCIGSIAVADDIQVAIENQTLRSTSRKSETVPAPPTGPTAVKSVVDTVSRLLAAVPLISPFKFPM